MHSTTSLLAALTFAVCALGCARERGPQPATAPPSAPASPIAPPAARGGGPIVYVAALDVIAEARCDREEQCGSVGPSARYADRSACLRESATREANALDMDECTTLRPDALERCAAEVRSEPCGSAASAVGRLAACRIADLCRR